MPEQSNYEKAMAFMEPLGPEIGDAMHRVSIREDHDRAATPRALLAIADKVDLLTRVLQDVRTELRDNPEWAAWLVKQEADARGPQP